MQANKQIEHWHLRGKIGLRQKNKAHSAYLNWQQCGDYYDIRLSGPFGQGAARLYGNKQRATLLRSDQTRLSASSPEQLLAQELGWSIPVSQLLYWIRGIPEPNNAFTPSATHTGFKQSDWQVSYPTLSTVDRFSLPTKAIAKQSNLTVTLILKHWDLNPECEPAL
jgi:outer membrane lipoprotein LolB